MKHLYFALSFVLFFAYTVSAQNTNPLDEEYTPDQNSHFGSNSARVFSIGYQEGFTVKHMIKFPVTQLFRSEFAVNYEYQVNDYLSLRGGLGYAYGADLVQLLASAMEIDIMFEFKNIGDLDYTQAISNSKISKGSLVEYLGIRYNLPNDNGSSFIELAFKNSPRNLTLSNNSYTTYTPTETTTNSKFYYVSVGTSSQKGDKKVKYVHEFSINLGLRKVTWEQYNLTGTHNNETFTKNGIKNSWLVPHFCFRYELGFGF